MNYTPFCTPPKCVNCGHYFWYGEAVYLNKDGQHICQQCSEREHMPNIKITAEVDGKQVPLDNISTETFEAIKALEKPKEIPVPVARTGDFRHSSGKKLFLKISDSIKRVITKYPVHVIVIDLHTGDATNWRGKNECDIENSAMYENIKPL